MTERVAEILVVDDTPENLELLQVELQRHGYKVRPAPDGEMALRAAGMSTPDLILLDICMPGLDGYAVCKRLKADPDLRDVPVIFLSALDETGDKLSAFEAGGVDYVTKPFQFGEVLARVSTHLKLRRTLRELEEALEEVTLLRGFLPICAHCKNVRDDDGFWHGVESYVSERSELTFSHGICPGCVRSQYGSHLTEEQLKQVLGEGEP